MTSFSADNCNINIWAVRKAGTENAYSLKTEMYKDVISTALYRLYVVPQNVKS